jgi:hypothetical protein
MAPADCGNSAASAEKRRRQPIFALAIGGRFA